MPEIRLRDYVVEIKKMIREVHLDEAIAHCQHILQHYPKYIEPYCLLGEACLEEEAYREAVEFFQRTLSGDPENLIARVGLGIIYDEQGALPEAIWQLQRAFELAPGNAEVRRELQRLYARRDGSERGRLKLTRGALGRLYARNGLYERAIGEFQAVLHQDPDLPDIQMALAESLWREGRRLEAVETCQDLLEKLPNCLKANLILGVIWVGGENVEAGEERLELARMLDPENLVAEEMMGQDSPLPSEKVLIPKLEDVTAGLGFIGPAAEAAEIEAGEVAVAATAAALAAEDELPDWLRDVGVVVEEEPALDLEVEEPVLADVEAEEVIPSEVPDWLQEVVAEEGISEARETVETEGAPPGEEAIEWRLEAEQVAGPVDIEQAEPEVEEAGWLVDAGILGEEEEEAVPAGAAEEDIPEWLRELIGGEAPAAEEVPAEPARGLESLVVVAATEEILSHEEVSEEGWEVEAPEEEAVVTAEIIELEETAQVEVPASLSALVDAGLLDEADLESALAEMSAEELASQRAEDIPDWLQELIGEAAEPVSEEAVPKGAVPKEAVPPAEVPPSREPDLVPAEETPAWLRELAEPVEEEEMPAAAALPEAEALAPAEEELAVVEEVALPMVGEPEEELLIAEEVALPVVGEPEEELPIAEEVALPVVGKPEEELPIAEEVTLPVVGEPEEELPIAEEIAPPVVGEPEEELPAAEEVALPEAKEKVAPPSRVDELVEQLKTRPRDTNLRLELARLYVAEQSWDAALAQYGKLISARKQLTDVIQDLEPLEQTAADRTQLYQLLGDAYMHQDELDKALQMYRQARQSLGRH